MNRMLEYFSFLVFMFWIGFGFSSPAYSLEYFIYLGFGCTFFMIFLHLHDERIIKRGR